MSTINIPGFTAEASLYKTTELYSMTEGYEGVRKDSIQPQVHFGALCSPCFCKGKTVDDPLNPLRGFSCFRTCCVFDVVRFRVGCFDQPCWPWEF
jgi:hypothetical protein